MASFNVTVQHSSPLISYTTSWLDTPAGDQFTSSYTNASFHATNVAGASVTFKFNGTGVWFYGAKRPGYGKYSLTVDGHSVVNGSASSSNAIFDQALGGHANMSMGEHTAVFRNEGDGYVDFDSLIFETQIGDKGQQVSHATLEDTDAAISYQPSASTWSKADGQQFRTGSTHFTQAHDAQAKLSFTGDAIAVYGGSNFDHGDYTVVLDGKSSKFNGASGGVRMYHAQNLLYFADNIKSGNHDLSIQVGSGFFDLDHIVVYRATGEKSKDAEKSDTKSATHSAASVGNFHVNANASNDTSGSTSKSMPKTVIVGIVVASIVGFISLLLIAVFLVKQCRKRRDKKAAEQGGGDDFSPVFPIQPPTDLEKGEVKHEEYKHEEYKHEEYPADEPYSHNKSNRFTAKSFASRWSQQSFSAGPTRNRTEAPPVPTLPQISIPPPQLNMPVPRHVDPPRSPLSLRHEQSPDDDASVLDDYYYHNDRARTPTQAQPQAQALPTVAPLRPHRPPGLSLGDVGSPSPNRFESVPL